MLLLCDIFPEKGNQNTYVRQHRNRENKIKNGLSYFVSENKHPKKAARKSSQKRKDKEGGFRYSPFVKNCFCLVYAHYKKQYKAKAHIIAYYLTICRQSRSPLSKARRRTSAVARFVATGILCISQSLSALCMSGS